MRSIVISVLICGLILVLDGCFTPPTYPIVPKISFAGLTFEKLAPPDFPTLVLMLNFTDGDGDLGLDPRFETDTAFVERFYVTRQNQYISSFTLEKFPTVALVDFKFVKRNPTLRLPNGSPFPPLNCKNWLQRTKQVNNLPQVQDTVYMESNESYYNILVDLFIDDGTGNFKIFDPNTSPYFTFPTCPGENFNGRFPVLSSDPGKKAPLDGTLTYRIKSLLTEGIIGSKRFKLSVQILDRAYNRSNIIETEPTTLAAIRRI
ncbi:MAG: hypothetical protein ACKO13_05550 [Cytophagales bacterium]